MEKGAFSIHYVNSVLMLYLENENLKSYSLLDKDMLSYSWFIHANCDFIIQNICFRLLDYG